MSLEQFVHSGKLGNEGELSVQGMCHSAEVSRAGFYRVPWASSGVKTDMEVRDAMQRIALEFPSYGWPRMTAELRRRGWVVNHKRVYRLMRADNLLCLRRRKFILTTDSDHDLPVYPNLAREMRLSDIDQLWVADLTYIRLETEFVYLAVVLDAFSRRCVGWSLQRRLDATLVLEALRMAVKQRCPRPGLVHHSVCNMLAGITPENWDAMAFRSA